MVCLQLSAPGQSRSPDSFLAGGASGWPLSESRLWPRRALGLTNTKPSLSLWSLTRMKSVFHTVSHLTLLGQGFDFGVFTPGLVLKSQLHLSRWQSLSWVFGYNSHLPVFNLLDEEYRMILYVSSHTAVIHDVLRNQQYHLQVLGSGSFHEKGCLLPSLKKKKAYRLGNPYLKYFEYWIFPYFGIHADDP